MRKCTTLTVSYSKELHKNLANTEGISTTILYNYYHPSIPHYTVAKALTRNTIDRAIKQFSIGTHSIS